MLNATDYVTGMDWTGLGGVDLIMHLSSNIVYWSIILEINVYYFKYI